EISSDTIMSKVLNDTNAILTSDKKRGRPEDTIWKHMNKTRLGDGHSKAQCIYCKKEWARGKIDELKLHLAKECLKSFFNLKISYFEEL
ncbi:13723_t:CDS:1, partial [Acaulospora morrowiae]